MPLSPQSDSLKTLLAQEGLMPQINSQVAVSPGTQKAKTAVPFVGGGID
jgi:hypothetical protein